MLQIDLWKRIVIWGVVALGLLLALPNAFYPRVESHNDAVKALEIGASGEQLEEQAGRWPSWVPSSLVNLGLDLRGGAHLLAEVQVADVYKDRMDGMWPDVRDALREKRDTVGTIRRQSGPAGELRVKISRPEGMADAIAAVRALARPVTSLTGVGSNDIVVSGNGDV